MRSKLRPAHPENRQTDWTEESETGSQSSTCPFCGKGDDSCTHWLGSRDLHFCKGFTVLDGGALEELGDLFAELEAQIGAFLHKYGAVPKSLSVNKMIH